MIHQIIDFMSIVAETPLMEKNLQPKSGLHLEFSMNVDAEGRTTIDPAPVTERYAGDLDLTPFLRACAQRNQRGWCISTNKCMDLPARGIHSCSPYMVAFKRDSLPGPKSKKYDKDKEKVFERFVSYLDSALELVDPEEQARLSTWRAFLADGQKLLRLISEQEEYAGLKEQEYVVLYLSAPLEQYELAAENYLQDKLFNTSEYNELVESTDTLYGTSNFYNSYPSKKPFLQHQTATFDIAQRISSRHAKYLYQFEDLLRRKVFPQPLPIFVNSQEAKFLNQTLSRLLNNARNERPNYSEVFQELHEASRRQLSNFYLLYADRNGIWDFDFVPKFRYYLGSEENPWRILPLFSGKKNTGAAERIENVFQFQRSVLPRMFNNNLVVKGKDDAGVVRLRYFEDLDPKYFANHTTYVLVQQYRRNFYDYIYKSRREALTDRLFDEMMDALLIADLLDDRIEASGHTKQGDIYHKLNLWLSLRGNFGPELPKRINMADRIQEYRNLFADWNPKETEGERPIIKQDETYAFMAGQCIYYLFGQSKAEQIPHTLLVPFLRSKSHPEFKQKLTDLFEKYSHGIFTAKFREVCAQVQTFDPQQKMKELRPLILAGYFSDNQLYGNKTA